MATLLTTLLTRSEALQLIGQRFKKLYYPLITIAYLCDPIARNKRPINVTDRQIRGVRGWLLEHYKNDEKKTATVYAELLELRAKLGPFSRPLNWAAAKKMDLILWWKSLFLSYTKLV